MAGEEGIKGKEGYSVGNCPYRERGLVDGRRKEVYGCMISGEMVDGKWRYKECGFRGEDYGKCPVFQEHNQRMASEGSAE